MTLGLVVGLCIEGDIIALFEPDPGADLVETVQGQNIVGVAAERRQLVPVPDPRSRKAPRPVDVQDPSVVTEHHGETLVVQLDIASGGSRLADVKFAGHRQRMFQAGSACQVMLQHSPRCQQFDREAVRFGLLALVTALAIGNAG